MPARRVTLVRRLGALALVAAAAPPTAACGVLDAGQARAGGVPAGRVVGVDNASGWGGADVRRAASIGARWDRVEFGPGQSRRHIDTMFRRAAAARVRILPLLNRYQPLTPTATDAFAAWASRFLRRYGAGGRFWRGRSDAALAPRTFEVLNEAYGRWWPHAGWPDPAGYVRLFERVARAGKAIDPGYRFLFSATYSVPYRGRWQRWADLVTEADPGIGTWIDGLVVHPYGPRALAGDPNVSYAATRAVRASFAARGIERPIWITEVGTCSSPQGPPALCGDERAQADAIHYYFADLRATPWVAALFVYGWRDLRGTDRRRAELWYGLLTNRGRPKPAYAAFREEARGA
jgi:hypothetical protein